MNFPVRRSADALRRATDDPAATRRLFVYVLALTLSLRTVLAVCLPFTGDEAYFQSWGIRPDWGFYDHPPMVGWWPGLLSRLSWRPACCACPLSLRRCCWPG
jgi:hypothetical protein